jgi:hypothetical protein
VRSADERGVKRDGDIETEERQNTPTKTNSVGTFSMARKATVRIMQMMEREQPM